MIELPVAGAAHEQRNLAQRAGLNIEPRVEESFPLRPGNFVRSYLDRLPQAVILTGGRRLSLTGTAELAEQILIHRPAWRGQRPGPRTGRIAAARPMPPVLGLMVYGFLTTESAFSGRSVPLLAAALRMDNKKKCNG